MQNMPMELSGDQILEHEETNHALLDIGQIINLCAHYPCKKVLESKWIIYVIKKIPIPYTHSWYSKPQNDAHITCIG